MKAIFVLEGTLQIDRGNVDERASEPLEALHTDGIEIVIFSVRPGPEQWLKQKRIKYNSLLTRPENDLTSDVELKKRWLDDYDKDDILCVFDNDKQAADMFRQEGLIVFQYNSEEVIR